MIHDDNFLCLNDETEVSLLKFLVSQCREFIETFFVGFVSFSIVSVNFGFVDVEYFLSISVFKH